MVTEAASYERQQGETREAYDAFCAYRDLGPKRSVDAAYNSVRQSSGKSAAKRAGGTWWKWAAENEWKRRSEAFDDDDDRKRREQASETRWLEVEAYRHRVVIGAQTRAIVAEAMLAKASARLEAVDVDRIPVTSLPAFLKAATQAWRDAIQLEGIGLAILDEDGNLPDDSL